LVWCEAYKEEDGKEEAIERCHHHHLSSLTKLWLSREELLCFIY